MGYAYVVPEDSVRELRRGVKTHKRHSEAVCPERAPSTLSELAPVVTTGKQLDPSLGPQKHLRTLEMTKMVT